MSNHPLIARPVSDDQPQTYTYRELRIINGQSYYFYHLDDKALFNDDESKFASYLDTLTGLDFTPPNRFQVERRNLALQNWKCECEVCVGPPRSEPFVTVKDYKVIEGIRLVECRSSFGSQWLKEQLHRAESAGERRQDFFNDWCKPRSS